MLQPLNTTRFDRVSCRCQPKFHRSRSTNSVRIFAYLEDKITLLARTEPFVGQPPLRIQKITKLMIHRKPTRIF